MITTDFIYIFLNVLALVIFMIAGRNISANGNNYWRYARWCIVTFTLLLGLRVNRGNDYVHYMNVYIHDLERNDLLFTSINHVLKYIGVGEHWIFMYYSGAYIIGAMIMLQEYRQYSKYLFPLFLMAFTIFSEYMIRQAFGFTFVFVMIKYLLDDNLKLKAKVIRMALCFLLAYSIHSANAVTALALIGVYYFIRFPLPPNITVPAFLFASYVFSSVFDFSYLSGILSFLGDTNDKFASYTDRSDRWFSSEAMGEGYIRNPIVKVLQTCGECGLFYLGYKSLQMKPDRNFLLMYNFYVIGSVYSQCFYTLEIMRRMGDVMWYFWAFPLAYVFSCRKQLYNTYSKKLTTRYLIRASFVALIFFSYDYLKYLFFRTKDMYHFIWDL